MSIKTEFVKSVAVAAGIQVVRVGGRVEANRRAAGRYGWARTIRNAEGSIVSLERSRVTWRTEDEALADAHHYYHLRSA